ARAPKVGAVGERGRGDRVPPLYTLTVEQAREADLAAIRAVAGEPEPVHEVVDRTLPGPAGELPVRLYRPSGEGLLPGVVYLFGGGWALGSIDTSEWVLRSLAHPGGGVGGAAGVRVGAGGEVPGGGARLRCCGRVGRGAGCRAGG